MADKYNFDENKIVALDVASASCRDNMSEDALDLYENSDGLLWMDEAGRIYEFYGEEPDEKAVFRSFNNWDDFNKHYPY